MTIPNSCDSTASLLEHACNFEAIQTSINENGLNLSVLKNALTCANDFFHQKYIEDPNITPILVKARALFIDKILSIIWTIHSLDQLTCSLIAVGGYGRIELLPHSDIDILVLFEDEQAISKAEAQIQKFLLTLWDLNLNIGHSVRTISDTLTESNTDLTVVTTLIESRTIAGDQTLLIKAKHLIRTQGEWNSKSFFKAKVNEQKTRHLKFKNTEYNLEPNIKNSPGGLRDLQTLSWIVLFHFNKDTTKDLVQLGFIKPSEYDQLNEAQFFLWKLRYALHMISDRPEDRLVFDHQRKIATLLNYETNKAKLDVESMMQDYYRTALKVSELNILILQHFSETIMADDESAQIIIPIDEHFQIRAGGLEAKSPDIFTKDPSNILEIFILFSKTPEAAFINAFTIRLLKESIHLINDDFRKNAQNNEYFIEIFKKTNNKFIDTLKLMKRIGILGRYLPEFGKITGQMQHDLFHIYTVDAHTIMLLDYLYIIQSEPDHPEFNFVHLVMKGLPKKHLIYIAGLYHDIGKGRGGDHSELGQVDAMAFCEQHNLGDWDTEIVSWLVASHLWMSTTAQKQDLSDPEVIQAFASKIGSTTKLDFLYILTVADINATNTTLWNGWKAALLRQLYTQTRHILRHGTKAEHDREYYINRTQQDALKILSKLNIDEKTATDIWTHAGDDYFLRETADDIAWHIQAIVENGAEEPIVLLKDTDSSSFDGATQIFICTKDMPNLFATTVAVLEQFDLNIYDARIMTSKGKYSLDTFIVLDENDTPLTHQHEKTLEVQRTLKKAVAHPELYVKNSTRRIPRRLKQFKIKPFVSYLIDNENQRTEIEVTATDRPGLLARIARTFTEFDVNLVTAKIATLGERVEDIFYLETKDGNPILSEQLCQDITTSLTNVLNDIT